MWRVCSKIFQKTKTIISSVCFSSLWCSGTDLSEMYWFEGISKNRFASYLNCPPVESRTLAKEPKKNVCTFASFDKCSIRTVFCRSDLQLRRQAVGWIAWNRVVRFNRCQRIVPCYLSSHKPFIFTYKCLRSKQIFTCVVCGNNHTKLKRFVHWKYV